MRTMSSAAMGLALGGIALGCGLDVDGDDRGPVSATRGGADLGAAAVPAQEIEGELAGYGEVGAIDVDLYRVDLEVDPDAETFSAYTSLSLRLLEPARVVALDLAHDVVVDDVAGTFSHWRHLGDVLYLVREEPLGPAPANVSIAYHGQVNEVILVCEPDFGGLMVGGNRSGRTIVHSSNWPNHARRWIPSHDHPSDAAAVELSVTLPAELAVVASGALVEVAEREGGRRRWSWAEPREMPTHAMHFAAFPWVEHDLGEVDGVPVRAYLYGRDVNTAAALQEAVPALAWMRERLGELGWSKYAMMATPLCGGSRGEATAVSLDESDLTDPVWARRAAVREAARHWLGSGVRIATWNDAWWPQALSGYLTVLYIRDTWGIEAEAMFLAEAWEVAQRMPPSPLHPAGAEAVPSALSDDLADSAGVWAMRSLHQAIGDDAFWRAVRAIVAEHDGAAIDTATVRALFEREAEADLGWLFEGILTRPGTAELSARVDSWDPATGRATLTVTQHQPELRVLPLDVAVTDETGAIVRARVHLGERIIQLPVTLAAPPVRAIVDPDNSHFVHTRCTTHDDCGRMLVCTFENVCAPPPW